MRNGQNKRMRNRNRKSQNPLSRVFESTGPDVKIRGTATQVGEKYTQLARDAQAVGDYVAAENYYQHAEHYFRIIASAQEQLRQNQPYFRGDNDRDEGDDDNDGFPSFEPGFGQRDQPQPSIRDHAQPRDNGPRDSAPRDNGPRDNSPRDNGPRDNGPRDQGRREQPYPPREQPSFQRRHDGERNAQPAASEEGNAIERLPSFITGSAGNGGDRPIADRGERPERSGDRYPHRRRRRPPHGARPDTAATGAEDFGPGTAE